MFAELSCRQPDVLILVRWPSGLYVSVLSGDACMIGDLPSFYFLVRMNLLTIWTLSRSMLCQRPSTSTKEVG